MKTYEEIKLVLDEHIEHLLAQEGVHAVGIGYSTEEGHTDELSIHVYVKSEEEANCLLQKKEVLEGTEPVSTCVIVSPQVTLDLLYVNKDEILPDDSEYRPLQGGAQLFIENHESAWLGTLGTFVKPRNASDDNLYILSNLHVLDALERAVYQPSKRKKDGYVAVTKVARSFPNTDAALAKMNDGVNVKANTILDIGKVSEIQSLTTSDLSKKVIKRGRTTLLTEGTITTISASVNVEISEGVARLFTDCVIVKPDSERFSAPGDSGSGVVLKENNKLVGLHFAGSGDISVFCKIDNVFSNLNVELPKSK